MPSSFDVTFTVPKGYQAVGNGELVRQRSSLTSTTTHWQQKQPSPRTSRPRRSGNSTSPAIAQKGKPANP